MSQVKIKVDASRVADIPERLTKAEKEMLTEVAQGISDAIGEASGSARIQAGMRVQSVSKDRMVILVGEKVPFARIRDRGGTIKVKRGRVLHFANGEFRPGPVRVKGIGYIKKGVMQATGIVDREFKEAFSHI